MATTIWIIIATIIGTTIGWFANHHPILGGIIGLVVGLMIRFGIGDLGDILSDIDFD